ncbi:MAG TPA: hypothetical protein ENN12_05270 [Epsilonproteobacteria bacterium]|nr:hypothetical protein [Campylobacterota bacterium]
MKYLEKKAKYFNIKLDELHVTTLSIDGKYYIKDSEHSMSIEDFKKINISGHQKVYLKISRKPYLVGYIPLNEFEDASYYEMRATC